MEELVSLIERTRSGQLDAYGGLVRRFQDMAVGYAYSLLGDFHLAEDAAQEAFVRAYLELSELRQPEAFPGWFRRIVHTQCTRLLRGAKPTTVELDNVSQVAAQSDPARELENRQQQDQLAAALDALDERDRSITTLFYIGQFTQKEIAAFLDVPTSTINNRLHLSRKRLKKELMNMTTEQLQTNRPSRDETFAARIDHCLQTIENLHRNLAADLERIISETLEKQAAVSGNTVSQTVFDTFVQSLPSPSLTLHYLMEPSNGRIIFDLSPQLAQAVATKLVGTAKRDWKETQEAISLEDWAKLGPFGRAIEARLVQLWKPVFAMDLKDGVWESNIVGFIAHPDFDTIPGAEKLAALHEAPNDLVVRVDFTVEAPNLNCRLALCYPAAALEVLLPHLS